VVAVVAQPAARLVAQVVAVVAQPAARLVARAVVAVWQVAWLAARVVAVWTVVVAQGAVAVVLARQAACHSYRKTGCRRDFPVRTFCT
jgi:hypothetical protein